MGVKREMIVKSLQLVKLLTNTAVAIFVSIFLTIMGLRNFMVGFNINSVQDFVRVLGLESHTQKVYAILEKLGKTLNADRVFLIFYVENSKGETVSVFQEEYQWQKPGLLPIDSVTYDIDPGESKNRYLKHRQDDCSILITSKMPAGDALRGFFEKSGTVIHASCPITLSYKKKEVLGAIAAEFGPDQGEIDEQVTSRELYESGAQASAELGAGE